MYQPIHSDFLIHWTGAKEIDNVYDPDWHKSNSSDPNPEIIEPYLRRLKSILKHGLWMNQVEEDRFIKIDGKSFERPLVARTCFTELKLSEARAHAKEFGRLGIGFKRMFLFNRLGAPMVYYGPKEENWFFPPFLHGTKEKEGSEYSFCFLKPMIEGESGTTLKYNRYDESEWRIIYSPEIKQRLRDLNKDNISMLFKELRDNEYTELENDLRIDGVTNRPRYLVPLKNSDGSPDKWFAMIIYPNLSVKVAAEKNKEIRHLIRQLKPDKDNEEKVAINAWYEKFSKPIEIDLDACRNF